MQNENNIPKINHIALAMAGIALGLALKIIAHDLFTTELILATLLPFVFISSLIIKNLSLLAYVFFAYPIYIIWNVIKLPTKVPDINYLGPEDFDLMVAITATSLVVEDVFHSTALSHDPTTSFILTTLTMMVVFLFALWSARRTSFE